MTSSLPRTILPAGLAVLAVGVLYKLIASPGSQNGWVYLGSLLALEIVAVLLWHFNQAFFPALILVFLAAGTGFFFYSAALTGRWAILAIGAAAGFVIYVRHRASFGAVHLAAAFCVISALVSAMASTYPRLALLKTGSLFLVFLYAATGARMAAIGRETRFIHGLLLGCEILVYVTAVSYFGLRVPFFGNPNSLGVVMGVAVAPMLLWGFLTSEGTPLYPRRLLALAVCFFLLLSSYSRAGIGAGVVAAAFLCFVFRRYGLLLKGAGIVVLGALIVAATVPLPNGLESGSGTLLDTYLYKGHTDEGVLGSREAPWQQTSDVIKRYPWFGSGFGTSTTNLEGRQNDFAFQSGYGSLREHGSSYLAILEWEGLLGVVPFALLIALLLLKVRKAAVWLRRTNHTLSPLAPVTTIVLAGLLHAAFEDWLFAPGYYMCVFFWSMAFIQVDLVASCAETVPGALPTRFTPAVQNSYSAAVAGR